MAGKFITAPVNALGKLQGLSEHHYSNTKAVYQAQETWGDRSFTFYVAKNNYGQWCVWFEDGTPWAYCQKTRAEALEEAVMSDEFADWREAA